MNKYKYLYFMVAVVIAGVFSAQAVSARVDRVEGVNTKSGKEVFIPAHAVEVAPNVFSLGVAEDSENGDVVEGFLFVHKKDENNGRLFARKGLKPEKGGGGCYGYIAKGAKWKTVEPWVVNPFNPSGLNANSVFASLVNSILKWEDAANGRVGDNISSNIIGEGSITTSELSADTVSMDNQNEIYFGDLGSNTIGVTVIWGIFNGPVQFRELREWDQVYNTYYDWSDDGNSSDMDFENIATHELGHSFGLGDLYESNCSDQTMYGYSFAGDLSKRDLNSGDIAGISRLY